MSALCHGRLDVHASTEKWWEWKRDRSDRVCFAVEDGCRWPNLGNGRPRVRLNCPVHIQHLRVVCTDRVLPEVHNKGPLP